MSCVSSRPPSASPEKRLRAPRRGEPFRLEHRPRRVDMVAVRRRSPVGVINSIVRFVLLCGAIVTTVARRTSLGQPALRPVHAAQRPEATPAMGLLGSRAPSVRTPGTARSGASRARRKPKPVCACPIAMAPCPSTRTSRFEDAGQTASLPVRCASRTRQAPARTGVQRERSPDRPGPNDERFEILVPGHWHRSLSRIEERWKCRLAQAHHPISG
jgi:hypothetical protein